jgi:uncharacterized protein (TIGR03437 family)
VRSAVNVLDGASFTQSLAVPGGIASIFGANLSAASATASGSLPSTLGGVTLSLCGVSPRLFHVSQGQINFLVPTECEAGRNRLSINGDYAFDLPVVPSAPTLFVVSGPQASIPLGFATIVEPAGQRDVPLFNCGGQPSLCSPAKLDLRNASELYIVLYATGVGGASKESFTARMGEESGEVLFVGRHPDYPGLDQINLLFRREQLRQGALSIRVATGGLTSNSATLDLTL